MRSIPFWDVRHFLWSTSSNCFCLSFPHSSTTETHLSLINSNSFILNEWSCFIMWETTNIGSTPWTEKKWSMWDQWGNKLLMSSYFCQPYIIIIEETMMLFKWNIRFKEKCLPFHSNTISPTSSIFEEY